MTHPRVGSILVSPFPDHSPFLGYLAYGTLFYILLIYTT